MRLCVDLCVNSHEDRHVIYSTSKALHINIMATNLSIDPDLLEEALALSGLSTKKDTVNQALSEFIQRRRQQEIIALFGKTPADEDYDYKERRA